MELIRSFKAINLSVGPRLSLRQPRQGINFSVGFWVAVSRSANANFSSFSALDRREKVLLSFCWQTSWREQIAHHPGEQSFLKEGEEDEEKGSGAPPLAADGTRHIAPFFFFIVLDIMF
tara:strand:+ start:223 stop:579 length:357 start_codon:yes stop_codon:yes gene_type:complete